MYFVLGKRFVTIFAILHLEPGGTNTKCSGHVGKSLCKS